MNVLGDQKERSRNIDSYGKISAVLMIVASASDSIFCLVLESRIAQRVTSRFIPNSVWRLVYQPILVRAILPYSDPNPLSHQRHTALRWDA